MVSFKPFWQSKTILSALALLAIEAYNFYFNGTINAQVVLGAIGLIGLRTADKSVSLS